MLVSSDMSRIKSLITETVAFFGVTVALSSGEKNRIQVMVVDVRVSCINYRCNEVGICI